MENSLRKVVVDDEVIASDDEMRIITPVWFGVSIYDGEARYNDDLSNFSLPQRYVLAIMWYQSEVNNGGHEQFYSNSAGLVWEDALKGFLAIGARKNYNILRKSANMLGGNPSKDWETRQDELDNIYEHDFEKLDNRYYDSESAMFKKLHKYIKKNASSFYFDGMVAGGCFLIINN